VRRRVFLACAAAVLAVACGVGAQPSEAPRIGYLSSQSALAAAAAHAAFREGLREHGYVEGRNVAIEWRFAEGRIERLPALAAELARLKVDVIFVSTGPGAVAARKATATIPIVFMAVSDPVALGLVANWAHPGGNVTGLSNVTVELTQKRLALLRELVPGARKIGILKPSATPETVAGMKEIDGAVKSLGLAVHVEDVTTPERFDRAFAAMKAARAEVVILVPSPLFYTHRARVAELAKQARLPLMGNLREFADAGALLSYGHSVPDMARRGAAYVARILKGARPADLPVEQPTKFELVINMRTAKALGLTVPQSVLLQADQLIQ
jgi:putative ABC transport system substrate-binding protein